MKIGGPYSSSIYPRRGHLKEEEEFLFLCSTFFLTLWTGESTNGPSVFVHIPRWLSIHFKNVKRKKAESAFMRLYNGAIHFTYKKRKKTNFKTLLVTNLQGVININWDHFYTHCEKEFQLMDGHTHNNENMSIFLIQNCPQSEGLSRIVNADNQILLSMPFK